MMQTALAKAFHPDLEDKVMEKNDEGGSVALCLLFFC